MSTTTRTIHDVWQDWHTHHDPDDRTTLLTHYAGIPKYIATRVAAAGIPGTIEHGDLVTYGILGLATAIDRYEPGKGAAFETFAHSRVRGAIIDGLRTENPVSRYTQDMVRLITDTIDTFTAEQQEPPRVDDIAEMTGIAVDVVAELVANLSAFSSPVQIDGIYRDARNTEATPISDLFPIPGPGQDGTDEQQVHAALLGQIVSELDSLQRAVVALLFLDQLTVPQVAEACDLGQRRVRRIRDAALDALRQNVDVNAFTSTPGVSSYRPTGTG